MPKPRIAIYWCASCGGCEEAFVDMAEGIVGVLEAVDIAFWPVALDFKKSDVRALPDKGLFAAFVNGAVRTSEQEEMARLLRRKSRHLIAYGACACSGGIPGLANLFTREQLLRFVYEDAPTVSNAAKTRPQTACMDDGRELELPELRNVVRALDQVVEVDYYVPGCPPTPKMTQEAIGALLSGKLPAKGAVLAPDMALCSECPRRSSKPTDLAFKAFRRPHEALIDPQKCLLAQGVVCMGPATRAGCDAACPAGNMPCTGCMGPTSRVRDQGAKMLSSLCASISARDDAAIGSVLDGIPDPVGTFYRYGLPKSLIRRKADLPAQEAAVP
jgi:F420-non-reducing hydrogenase small subunit